MLIYSSAITESNPFVSSIRIAVGWIYSQKIYTLCFLLFLMFYNLVSKFIYVPMSDILSVLNSKKVGEIGDERIKRANFICLKLMKVSTIMTLISYIIRILIILIFVGVFVVNNKIFTLLTTISVLFTIIQSILMSIVYFVGRKMGNVDNLIFAVKLSMFFSNIIGMIFQIIYICRILNPNSCTIFHIIMLMIYCGCINYLLMNQLYLSVILTTVNVLFAATVSFVLFWDYFIVNNYSKCTPHQSALVVTFFGIVSILFPLILFAITRYLISNSKILRDIEPQDEKVDN